MNKNQERLLNQVIKGNEIEFLNELMSFYLNNGLGSLTKKEIDIFIFYLIDKYQKNQSNEWSNYDWSCLLKISETKIKNLRLEVGIRYASDDEEDFNLWIKFLDLIKEGYIEKEDSKYIITIEDPYLLRFIEHKLKLLKLATTDYSFNKERIKFKPDSLEKLIKLAGEEIGTNQSYAENKIKSIKWDSLRSEIGKELYDMFKRAIPTIMSKIIFTA